MKISKKTALGAALGVGLMSAAMTGWPADNSGDMSSTIKDLQKQLGEMNQAITKLSKRLDKLENLTKPQEPQRFDVSLDRTHLMGNPQAKLGIVEFADYQCPYCRHFYQDAFPELKKNLLDTGKVAFMVRNFPLDFHAHAMSAALAVTCVAKQDGGAYWEMQHALFDHQEKLGQDYFSGLVHKYGLDDSKYQACVKDTAEKKNVQSDLAYAQSLGVTGTPTFFIGTMKGDKLVDAVRMEGAQPFAVFSQVIDYVKKHPQQTAKKAS